MRTAPPPAPPHRFPVITVATPRLLLRPVHPDDSDAVDGILTGRGMRHWLPEPARPRGMSPAPVGHRWCTDLADDRRRRADGDHYGLVRRLDQRVIGCLWTRHTDWESATTEVCVAVADDVRGFGFAAEATDALSCALLGEHSFQRLELRVPPGNLAARRVAEKAGFQYEGLLRGAGQLGAGRVDLECWSLLPSDLDP